MQEWKSVWNTRKEGAGDKLEQQMMNKVMRVSERSGMDYEDTARAIVGGINNALDSYVGNVGTDHAGGLLFTKQDLMADRGDKHAPVGTSEHARYLAGGTIINAVKDNLYSYEPDKDIMGYSSALGNFVYEPYHLDRRQENLNRELERLKNDELPF